MNETRKTLLTSTYIANHAVRIAQIFRCAVNDALIKHRRLGNSIATWKDGKVVIIPPEDIPVDEDLMASQSKPER